MKKANELTEQATQQMKQAQHEHQEQLEELQMKLQEAATEAQQEHTEQLQQVQRKHQEQLQELQMKLRSEGERVSRVLQEKEASEMNLLEASAECKRLQELNKQQKKEVWIIEL